MDAYLVITKERLGDRLTVRREIDPSVEERAIPRLSLQPIVENAVEHDLTKGGGEFVIRAYPHPETGALYLEAEHDGVISEEGWENIRLSLRSEPSPESMERQGGRVGIGNVRQRLTLLYGEDCSFTIEELRPGRVLARIVLPREERRQ